MSIVVLGGARGPGAPRGRTRARGEQRSVATAQHRRAPHDTDHHGSCHVYLSWAVPMQAHDSPGRLVPRLSQRTRKPELGEGEHLAHSVNPCVQCARLLGGRTPGNQVCFGNPVSYYIPSRSMSQEHGNQKGT